MESEILLSAQNVSHSFYLSKTASVRALDKLSFEIRRGEIYGLVGESGSGKSTAARCVMNLVKPQSGHIFYEGVDITDPKQIDENPNCKRELSLYGYVQGCNIKNGQAIHLLGVGDYSIKSLNRLPDPCPLPEKNPEKKGRRKLNEKEVLLYAPMSNVGKEG